jgi:hypothetical protein
MEVGVLWNIFVHFTILPLSAQKVCYMCTKVRIFSRVFVHFVN